MPATYTDRQRFLREIAAAPGEDTPRLAFADWLDENAEDAGCVECGGAGRVPYCSRFMYSCAELGVPCDCKTTKICGDCLGRPRAGPDAVRAAYIRRECGLPAPLTDLLASGLPAEHEARWRRVADCPACGGAGRAHNPDYGESQPCGGCWGGDLGGLADRPGLTIRVDWARGFPYRVYCVLADVAEPVGGRVGSRPPGEFAAWRPTAWARAVVEWHPVAEFYVELPFLAGGRRNAWTVATLPPFLFRRVEGHDSSTPEAAHTAMARALAEWAREFPQPEAA